MLAKSVSGGTSFSVEVVNDDLIINLLRDQIYV